MTSKSPLDQQIRQILRNHYAIDVKMIDCLNTGADINASVYKAIDQNQSRYFIKLRQSNHNDLSTIITDFLYQEGIQNIIPGIKTCHGQPFQVLDDQTLTVFPFIDGQDGFSTDLTDHQWQSLGKTIKKIHTIKYPQHIRDKIPLESYSAKWRQVLLPLDTFIDDLIATDSVAHALINFIKQHQSSLKILLDHAERLSHAIQDQTSDFVLCHSDLHAGNIMVDSTGKLFIVDWDQPILAPKERDLMFIGGGIGNVWNKPDEEVLFYQGYGSTTINRDLLAYYRINRILEDITEYCQFLLINTDDGGQKRQTWYQEFIDQFARNGVIDIALNLP
ncbi:MAG: aminoglycoside phosphotransferase family protein [Candidatus Paracaedibacteraceae bacterium]|nr:aminoglycoside phosphotransferase family protein [Candidatus Paracaedibacteraceae bacterium]